MHHYTVAYHNILPGDAYVASLCFLMEQLAEQSELLLDCVLLARLLSFKDGVLALYFPPGQCAIGQIPNNHR